MKTTRYKGFNILAWPYQLHDSKRWTVDLEIRRRGRALPVEIVERYPSKEEADARCAALGRQIIDGQVPGCSVDQLRDESWSWANLTHIVRREFMRQGRIAGIVILLFGAFVVLRGIDFSPADAVAKADSGKVVAAGPKVVPLWVGGIAMLVGVSLIVVGTRKRT